MTNRPCYWYKELKVLSRNQKLYPNNPEKERVLSPLTDLFLSCACFMAKKEKNFFLSIQSNKLDCLLILACISAKILKGNVIFYTNNPQEAFNKYFELRNPNSFLFYLTFAGIYKKVNNGNFELNIPRYYQTGAKSEYRKESIKDQLLKNINDQNLPSIIFADYSEIRRAFRINSIKLENEKFKKKMEFPIKGVLFSSFNNHFFGERYFQSFIDWTQEKIKNKWIFIHFNDPQKHLNQMIIEKLEMFGLYLNRSLLCQNNGISQFMDNYWEDEKVKCRCENRIAWNIDNSYLFSLNSSERFEVITIPYCNIDSKFNIVKDLFNDLNKSGLPKDQLNELYRFRSLLFKIQNRFSNPASRKIKFRLGDDIFYPYISDIIKFYKKLSKTISNYDNRAKFNEFCIQAYGIYRELEETSRFFEKNTYSRKGIDTILIEELMQLNHNLDELEDIYVVILCFDTDDTISLQKLIDICDLKLKYEIIIETIQKFHIQIIPNNSILLMPGIPFSNFFHIFNYSWKKIIIFTYHGNNMDRVKSFISSFHESKESEEQIAMNHLLKLWNFIGFNKSHTIVKKYYLKNRNSDKEKNQVKMERIPTIENPINKFNNSQCNNLDWLENIKKNLSNELGTINLDSKFFEEEEIELVIKKQNEEKLIEKETITEHGISTFQVINQANGNNEMIILHNDIPYIIFTKKTNGNFERLDLLPKYINTNSNQEKYLIYFKESARKNFIEIIEEMMDISEDIDFELIKLWKSKLFQAIPEKKSIKSQHTEFLKYSNISQSQFGNWIKGNINYTLNPDDIKYLGIIYDIPLIKENYQEIHIEGRKIHRIHLRIGMMLSKIIKQEIDKNLNSDNLNKEEESIQKFIRNNIYLISSKNMD